MAIATDFPLDYSSWMEAFSYCYNYYLRASLVDLIQMAEVMPAVVLDQQQVANQLMSCCYQLHSFSFVYRWLSEAA
jgi:hypothetical protein